MSSGLGSPPPTEGRSRRASRRSWPRRRAQPDTPERIAWLLPPTDGSATFLRIEAHKLLDPASGEAARLKGRVVIIAGEFPYFDRHRTPLAVDRHRDDGRRDPRPHGSRARSDGSRPIPSSRPCEARIFLAGLAVLAVVLGWRFQARRFDLLDWRVASFAVVAADALVSGQIRPPDPSVHACRLRLGPRHHAWDADPSTPPRGWPTGSARHPSGELKDCCRKSFSRQNSTTGSSVAAL